MTALHRWLHKNLTHASSGSGSGRAGTQPGSEWLRQPVAFTQPRARACACGAAAQAPRISTPGGGGGLRPRPYGVAWLKTPRQGRAGVYTVGRRPVAPGKCPGCEGGVRETGAQARRLRGLSNKSAGAELVLIATKRRGAARLVTSPPTCRTAASVPEGTWVSRCLGVHLRRERKHAVKHDRVMSPSSGALHPAGNSPLPPLQPRWSRK